MAWLPKRDGHESLYKIYHIADGDFEELDDTEVTAAIALFTESANEAAEEQAPEPLARSRPPRARKAVETFVAGPSKRPKAQVQAAVTDPEADADAVTVEPPSA